MLRLCSSVSSCLEPIMTSIQYNLNNTATGFTNGRLCFSIIAASSVFTRRDWAQRPMRNWYLFAGTCYYAMLLPEQLNRVTLTKHTLMSLYIRTWLQSRANTPSTACPWCKTSYTNHENVSGWENKAAASCTKASGINGACDKKKCTNLDLINSKLDKNRWVSQHGNKK